MRLLESEKKIQVRPRTLLYYKHDYSDMSLFDFSIAFVNINDLFPATKKT